jgi:hypothetical protein
MNPDHTNPGVPQDVTRFLNSYSHSIAVGKAKLLRLSPLLLRQPIRELLTRRASLFQEWEWQATPYGHTIRFGRTLKASDEYPEGRQVGGEFDLLMAEEDCCVVASALPQDSDCHGPRYFVKNAYPLARRPFLASAALLRLIRAVEKQHGWRAVSLDAMGYDVETRRFRRDLKRQPVDQAAAEMSEQRRQVHRILISFASKDHKEHMRVAFDRYGRAVVRSGDACLALDALVIPATRDAKEKSKTYGVSHSASPSRQEMIEIQFGDEAFAKYEDMEKLCRAVREQDGLSVTIVHLNPYLQAQVLDFLTGSAVEMAVMDSRTVSLVPRSGDCRETIPQIAAQVFRSFGEGEINRRLVAS